MRRVAVSIILLFAGVVAASGCTMVISSSPRQASQPPTEVVRPIQVYVPESTSAPTLTPAPPTPVEPTPAPTATSRPLPTPTPPVPSQPTATATPLPPLVHTVAEGETLSGIAAMYGVSLDELVAANAIADPSRIAIGQKLLIPDGGQAALPSPSATAATATEPATTPTEEQPTVTPAATEAVTASPTESATAAPSPSVPQPSVSETTVTVTLPEFEKGLYPLRPEEVGYPYDGLDLAKVGPPVPRQYKALVLENAYTSVMIIPALGGRIYRITDKATGRQVLYNNPAAVPTNWGMRGWWFAIGGIEWCLPTEEHGLVEYLPWEAKVEQSEGEAAVTVSTKERLTGVDVGVRISLDAAHSYVQLEPKLSNGGSSPQKLQFWINAMFAADSLHAGTGTRLILPASQALIHSTSDPGLPGSGKTIPWPIYGPRDLSLLSSWHGYIGAFAAPGAQAGFMGAQTPGLAGLMRIFPPSTATGAKFFGLGDIPASRYSQVDSSYLELWGGWTTNFWQYETLAGGQSVGWTEYWYPLPDMANVVAANNEVALAVDGSRLGLYATTKKAIEVEAFAGDGHSLGTWRTELSPGGAWALDQPPTGIARVQVRDAQSGGTLLSWPN